MNALDEILEFHSGLKEQYQQEELVEMLREIQELFGGISVEAQERISSKMSIGMPVIKNIIRLYPTLHEVSARHRITVCTGRQCAGKNSTEIIKKLEKELKISRGQTTKDGRFILDYQSCLKHCRTAPNMRIDDDLYTFVTPDKLTGILKRYK